MLQIVPVMELVGMRGREIDRGNQQTPAHGILPSLDPQRPQIIRRCVRSGANRLNSRFLLGPYDSWVSPYAAQQLLPAKCRNGSKADIDSLSSDVRFTPKSGHWLSASACPLCAKSRHSGCFWILLFGGQGCSSS